MAEEREPETEAFDPGVPPLEDLGTGSLLEVLLQRQLAAVQAVAAALPALGEAVDLAAARLAGGGRLFYVGAGTSGRLAVADAAEWPPTFGVPAGLVQALLAGGTGAFTTAVEAAEDDREAGARDLAAAGARAGDVVVGLSAGGRSPYVLGALEWARRQALATVGVAMTRNPALSAWCTVTVVVPTGPEALLGSTRMQAGTAEKVVLTLFSTAVMVRLGRTFRNLPVGIRAANAKLAGRARRLVAMALGCGPEEAGRLLAAAGGEVTLAVAMGLTGAPADAARAALAAAGGSLAALARRPGGAGP
ncbi:putative PTS component; possibly regulatory [Candidatus Hydrogenisulfobacillus filiaventi]|uniref:N-acetylmuramic acid 6-phosphate etherase n=1 Tax=Candidatus Hydrogenisulfobacillus filiaventi TaxID=2707344 RepID=A0A6F8ZIT0_9FIRM|nr:N-acetylmuramic acid 6-phosphate etherase [Bacillota bacterium]CAB1129789.1 putative PTS component; possibly regulatory [Candidatus Hydrogenisulfobacillus filiaventi]